MAGSGAAVSVSAGEVWEVSVRVGKARHLAPFVRTVGENAGAHR